MQAMPVFCPIGKHVLLRSAIVKTSFSNSRLGPLPIAQCDIVREDLWDRIESTWIPRVTAADAPQSHPRALCRAVSCYRFIRILGASRMEAAILPQKR